MSATSKIVLFIFSSVLLTLTVISGVARAVVEMTS